jgi:hypothetical protein
MKEEARAFSVTYYCGRMRITIGFYTLLREQYQIANYDTVGRVSPNIYDDKQGFAKYL